MRVLVTGAAGFVGQAVVRHLASAGYTPVALIHEAERSFPPGVEVRRADLRSPLEVASAVDGIDGVCHLAAVTRARESFVEPVRYFQVNVGGTLTLLDVLDRAKRPIRLVFASTAAVYGVAEVQPTNEEQPIAPPTPYAASKYAAELAIAWQAQTGRLGAVTLRMFNAAGASGDVADGDLTRIVPKAIAVASGREEMLEINGDGTAVRDFVHVDDLADAFVLAVEAAEPGEHRVYNVGALGASVADVVDAVERASGKKLPVRHLPPKPEPPVIRGDSTRIRAELGWASRRSTLDTIVSDAWNVEIGATG